MESTQRFSRVGFTYAPVLGVEVPQQWVDVVHKDKSAFPSDPSHDDPYSPAAGTLEPIQATASVDSRAAMSDALPDSNVVLSDAVIPV